MVIFRTVVLKYTRELVKVKRLSLAYIDQLQILQKNLEIYEIFHGQSVMTKLIEKITNKKYVKPLYCLNYNQYPYYRNQLKHNLLSV